MVTPDELELTSLPISPASLQDWTIGPASILEPRLRSLSQRAQVLSDLVASFSQEALQDQTSLLTRTTKTASSAVSIESYLAHPDSLWMRSVNRILDYAGVDSSLSKGVIVNSHEGAGLSPNSETEITPKTITVVRGTGIPGDNMELAANAPPLATLSPVDGSSTALASPGQEPTVSFQTDPRSNLVAMLSDKDSLFFDWERLYVPNTQRCAKAGTAYVYTGNTGQNITVKDVTNDYGWTATLNGIPKTKLAYFFKPTDLLTLVLESDLGTPQPMSHLDISVRQAGGVWPYITSVTVSGDGNQFFDLLCNGLTTWTGNAPVNASTVTTPDAVGSSLATATGQDSIGVSTWSVPAFGADLPPVRYIQIAFSQDKFYKCPKGIGHPYYVEVKETVKDSSSFFGISHSHSDKTETTRLPGPDPIIGVQTGQATTSTKQNGAILSTVGNLLDNPVLKANPTITIVGAGLQLLGSLFGSSTNSTKVLQAGEYTDVFDGYRQCISVRRLKAVERMFDTSIPGQFVTEDVSFGQVFSSVRLRVDDQTPGNSSIKYELSFDSGQTWIVVKPTDLALPASHGQAVILPSNKKTVKMRATLTTTDSHITPRLYGYSIEALPSLS